MKTAIVLGLFPVLSETFIVNHINALIDSGYDVDLYAYNKGQIFEVHESLKKHQLLDRVVYKEKMPGPKLKRFNKFLKLIIRDRSVLSWKLILKSLNFFKYGKNSISLQLFFQSFWFLKKRKYEIIHVHFGPVAFHISKLIKMGFLKGTRLVVTLHGYDINSKILNEHELEYQNLFSVSDLVLVNTEYSFQLVKSKFPTLENIHILPVGLNTHFFSPKHCQTTCLQKILFCGRLIRFKAPDLVIKVFNELVKRGYQNIRLEIIGEGSLRNELDILVDKFRLNSRVKFRGALSQTEIRNSMNKASLLLMPGIYDYNTCNTETQGLVIQEAQSMKLPVVISDAGGMKYGILKDKSGFIVEEGNVNDFADAVEKILTMKENSKKMGEIGRTYAVQNYDNVVINNQLLDKYRSLLHR